LLSKRQNNSSYAKVRPQDALLYSWKEWVESSDYMNCCVPEGTGNDWESAFKAQESSCKFFEWRCRPIGHWCCAVSCTGNRGKVARMYSQVHYLLHETMLQSSLMVITCVKEM
jgi:hypothetical protein